jgi:K+-sensing histidine kinase KdpD
MITKSKPISILRITHSLLAIVIVFALTALMLLIGSKLLGEGVIALLYLVPIGWCTIHWEQSAGVSAAMTAALSFDFFFIQPYHTFNIGSLEGWLLFFLFVAASILVVGRIQSLFKEEQNRERKATFLYETVVAIAGQGTKEGIATAIANQIQQNYLANLVQVHLYKAGTSLPLTISAGKSPEHSPNKKPDLAYPIVSGTTPIGEIAIWKGLLSLPDREDAMFNTILHQTSAAFDRVENTHI